MKIRPLRIELLERRVVLASAMGEALHVSAHEQADVEYFPMIVASGQPGDGPSDRVTTDYPATGSLSMSGRTGSYICTGTLIDDPSIGADYTGNDWVLTAGHCLDSNNNGRLDFKAKDVTFYPDGNTNNGIQADSLIIHPDFRGFGTGGSVSNDIALIKLRQPAPTSITPHSFHETPVPHAEFRMVGFGRSGDGANGYTTGASFSVKREGGNHLDDYGEGAGNSLNRDKIWRADFDHPTDSTYDLIGFEQLAPDVEANLGGGDSGGPSFLVEAGVVGGIAAINTFGFSVFNPTHDVISPPLFGSGMGGILVHPYLQWINDVMTGGSGGGDDGGGGGGKPKCHPKRGCSTVNATSLTIQDTLVSHASITAMTPTETWDHCFGELDSIGIAPGKDEVLVIVSTADQVRGANGTITREEIDSEATDSSDQVLEEWPEDMRSIVNSALHLI